MTGAEEILHPRIFALRMIQSPVSWLHFDSRLLYEPVDERLLPLDATWQDTLRTQAWPTPMRPQRIGPSVATLQSLIREHLFIALYRASAESLASENASRLAAMERADKNIEELLTSLRNKLHSQRQSSIDAELSDVLAGYEALSEKGHRRTALDNQFLGAPK